MEEKNVLQQAKERLLRDKTPGPVRAGEAELARAAEYCEGYKTYLDRGKTEREAVTYTVELCEAQGFVPFEEGKIYAPGDKVYMINRDKAIVLAVIGKKPVSQGVHLAAAHIDSPRLDLKPVPLYEKSGLAYLDTHYYGGIRKHQWLTIPLALHGRVVKGDGTCVDLCIGEKDDEPRFCITDLLPHLSAQQNGEMLGRAYSGEALDVLSGSYPYRCMDGSDAVKVHMLALLNEKYGITEEDFLSAELSMVPAARAMDIGFDRSMIGAYGHDDRVCAYPALTALLAVDAPEVTCMTMLVDKEEIGNDGVTGMKSDFLRHFVADLAEMQNVSERSVFRHMDCMSADVNAAYDPMFANVFEAANSSYMNEGVVVTKYTGSRGKSGASDASAEYMGKVRKILNDAGVLWQIGELGKVDVGGGGTVAKDVARMNVDVVDVGVPVMSMHAPLEIVSKLDVYMTAKAFEAYFRS